MNKQKLGTEIRMIREIMRISKNQVCRKIGIDIRRLNDIEEGRSSYTIDSLLAVLDAIGIDIELFAEIPAGEIAGTLPEDVHKEFAIRYWIGRKNKEKAPDESDEIEALIYENSITREIYGKNKE